MCGQQRLRPVWTYVQPDPRLCLLFEYSTTVKLQTEQLLEFLSLKGGCRGSSESIHVKMPHCWKSHVTAQLYLRSLLVETKSARFEVEMSLVRNSLEALFCVLEVLSTGSTQEMSRHV